MPTFDVGGGGPPIEGDPLQFVLAATGRIDAREIGLDETVDAIAWRSSLRSRPASS
jgi:hypothetical protein